MASTDSSAIDPPVWPDKLQKPSPQRVDELLHLFWSELAALGELLAKDEYLLANEQTHLLRQIVLEMMLALNGIKRPPSTSNLNGYLSTDQRAAIEKTMALPKTEASGWIGQAVSLVTIYRWYAPQLVDRFELSYPSSLETQVCNNLIQQLPNWPHNIRTD